MLVRPFAVLLVAATLLLAAPSSAFADTPEQPGIDVSHYQDDAGPIDWSQVGRAFVVVKAVQVGVDPDFAASYAAVRAYGMVRGSYDYAQPALPISTAVTQADLYAATIGSVQEAGDLPPVMDLETSGGLPPGQLISWAQTFLGELMARTGRVPVVYTGRSFWATAMLGSTAFTRYPLWIADLNPTPTLPLPGGWAAWTLWQSSQTGTAAGITGNVDLDGFNGTPAQLTTFADGTHPAVLPAVAPQAPYDVMAAPGSGSLEVSWLPADNGGLPVYAYRVTVSPGGATITVPGTESSAAVPGLSSSKLYTATVTALSPAGTSSASAASNASATTVGVLPVTVSVTKATTVLSGHSATLSGRVLRVAGASAAAGVRLLVSAKKTGGNGYLPVGSTTTSGTGSYTVKVKPGTTTRYLISVASAGWSPASASVVVTARAAVTAALSKTTVAPKARVLLRGQVSVAAAGRLVYRQTWSHNAWHSGPAAAVSKAGRYSFTLVAGAKGAARLRVILGSKPGLVGAFSKPVLLTTR